jgi:hypothetical protein
MSLDDHIALNINTFSTEHITMKQLTSIAYDDALDESFCSIDKKDYDIGSLSSMAKNCKKTVVRNSKRYSMKVGVPIDSGDAKYAMKKRRLMEMMTVSNSYLCPFSTANRSVRPTYTSLHSFKLIHSVIRPMNLHLL